MPDYRRNRVPGATYFFTVNLGERGSQLLTEQIASLRDAVRRVREAAPFHINGWVVLPDHVHCIRTLPEGDADYPRRWRAMKTLFSKRIAATQARTQNAASRGERGIWQRRYWEHTVRDDGDFGQHMDYVHFNPVKHHLAETPADWPFSSFRHCVARGICPADWMPNDVVPQGDGERDALHKA